ncbi:hypothetical protein PWT90_11100 [Aphanocladium album]|nr:hypothetical protein PWT90_11100 [Aphanocladium album]
MSLLEPDTTAPAASIPDQHTALEVEPAYNSSTCSSPRPVSLSLSIEQTTTATTTTEGPVIDEITDDMLSIHSVKSDSFGPGNAGAPALPKKSALRASRLLATLPQKLPRDSPVLTHAAPHLVYLSSEEDASSSADDLSDLDSFDSDSEESLDGYVSHGEFARAVSVVFSGKPSMVNLTSRSASLACLHRTDDSVLRTTSTEPTLGRTRSTSSTTSSLYHPPRSSSMITTSSLDKRRPRFLHVDPFAAGKDKDDTESLKTPNTPTAMFSRAFNTLKKKRSRPSLATTAAAAAARADEVVPMEQVGEEEMEQVLEEEPASPKSVPSGPVKYQDIIAAAKMNAKQPASSPTPAPATPTSPSSVKNGLRGFSLSRRMSVRV